MKVWLLTALLATAAWFTGNLLLVLVAMRLFVTGPTVAVTQAQVGALFADVLVHWLVVSCILVTAIAVAWLAILARRIGARRLGWDGAAGFVLVSMLIVSHALSWTTTRSTQRAVAERAQARADAATTAEQLDALEQRFRHLHRDNSLCLLIQTIVLAGLTIVQSAALLRRPEMAASAEPVAP